MTEAAHKSITLSPDQQAAAEAFFKFLGNPDEKTFVLSGGAGCGKSTLVGNLLERLPKYFKLMESLSPEYPRYTVLLTATTNKACEALADLSQDEVVTIYSWLRLVVQTDYKTKETWLVEKSFQIFNNFIVFVDEAGFVDYKLKRIIERRFMNSKIVYIGDADQLVPVGNTDTPMFKGTGPGAELNKVVRQAEGNPIIELATMFRHAVRTGEYGNVNPDGQHIVHCNQEEFEERILAEFKRPDWSYKDSKVLLWTNMGAVNYNNAIRNELQGQPEFKEGDYAICNSFVPGNKSVPSIKTDTTVHIQNIEPAHQRGIDGYRITINSCEYFMPKERTDRLADEKQLREEGEYATLRVINETWLDLRAVYACTINKSQGSTYDKVFIDLNDMRRCYNGNTLARLLYVAVSRARHQVVMTGDLN